MNTVNIEPGSSVVVFGTGGVGLSTIQGARIRGATDIVAVDIIPEKLDIAEEVGATHTVDSSEVNPVERVRDIADGGVEYAFEVVGHPAVIEQTIGCLSPTGTAVLVGVPPEEVQTLDIDLYDIVTSEKAVVGSFNGSYTLPVAIPKLASLAVSEDLRLEPLVTDTKPLSRVNQAMADLENGEGIRQVILP